MESGLGPEWEGGAAWITPIEPPPGTPLGSSGPFPAPACSIVGRGLWYAARAAMCPGVWDSGRDAQGPLLRGEGQLTAAAGPGRPEATPFLPTRKIPVGECSLKISSRSRGEAGGLAPSSDSSLRTLPLTLHWKHWAGGQQGT